MSEVAPDTGADRSGFSPVVASIFDNLLNSIHEGRLKPGDRLSDGALAKEFEVSRTPVREAIQRLRDLGLVEASAGRFTRIAIITPQRTAHATVVWAALYAELVDEVAGEVPDAVRDAMERDHEAYLAALPGLDYQQIANLAFSFFHHLMRLSRNPILVDGIRHVVYLIRLGSLDLPSAIDIAALGQAQAQLLDAIRSGRKREARRAIESVRGIRVPVE